MKVGETSQYFDTNNKQQTITTKKTKNDQTPRLSDEQQKGAGVGACKGMGFSYPWFHYHRDDRNGCRLETKSLGLI